MRHAYRRRFWVNVQPSGDALHGQTRLVGGNVAARLVKKEKACRSDQGCVQLRFDGRSEHCLALRRNYAYVAPLVCQRDAGFSAPLAEDCDVEGI